MIKSSLSQRLYARMQFKSLLLLTILASSASAQQPFLANGLSQPSTSNVPEMVQGRGSTWTLKQHATWLLGLRTRPATSVSLQPTTPPVPMIEMFASSEVTTSAVPASEGNFSEVTTESSLPIVQLVQHTEPVGPPALSSNSTNALTTPSLPMLATVATESENTPPGFIAAAVHTQSQGLPVPASDNAAPPSLNLGPVIGGPVPPLPLDRMDSLLQVDVSGVDASQVVGAPAKTESLKVESLIDGFAFQQPVQYSMRDTETASMAASPSHNKRVSIHEGFAPRPSTANQGADLGTSLSLSDHSTATQYSLSDKADKPSPKSPGPVHEKLVDKDESSAPSSMSKGVETSLSDRGPILAARPVASDAQQHKTSRSSQPVEIAPPSRLAKNDDKLPKLKDTASISPDALPVAAKPTLTSPQKDSSQASSSSANSSTASSSVSNSSTSRPVPSSPGQIGTAPLGSTANSLAQSTKSDSTPLELKALPGETLAAKKLEPPARLTEQPASKGSPKAESLIDGLVPPALPGLLADADIQDNLASATSPESGLVKVEPAVKPLAKADEPKRAEKFSLSDTNPIALTRPVVKAANVALPPLEEPAAVVPISHESDSDGTSTAEYSKLAAKMQLAVKQKFPGHKIKVTCNEDGLIAEGNVPNNSEASKVLSYLRKTSLCPVADRITTSR